MPTVVEKSNPTRRQNPQSPNARGTTRRSLTPRQQEQRSGNPRGPAARRNSDKRLAHKTLPRSETAAIASTPMKDDPSGLERFFLPPFGIKKYFTLFGFAVASGLILAFGADLTIGWPFRRASVLFDVTNVICGVGLGYLSWDVMRDQMGRH